MFLERFFKKRDKEDQENTTSKFNAYYFYIGKKLLNELLSSTKYDGQYEKYTFKKERRSKGRTGGSVKTKLPLFNTNLTGEYGQEDVLKYDKQNLANYVNKLRFLLNAPEYANEFNFWLNHENLKVPPYFRYIGEFQINEPISVTNKNTVVQIISKIEKTDFRILVDCSIVNFSEFIEDAGNNIQNIVHSGNRAFFNKEINIQVEGLFRCIQVSEKDKTIHARAIYLKLLDDIVIL